MKFLENLSAAVTFLVLFSWQEKRTGQHSVGSGNNQQDKSLSLNKFDPMKPICYIVTAIITILTSCSFKEVSVSGIKDYKIKKMSQEGIEVEVGVGLKNPNNYGFSICKSSFDASMGKKKLGVAKTANRVHVKAKSDETYYFLIKVNLDDFSLADLPALMGSGGKVNLKGNLVVGKFLFRKKIPIDEKTGIPGMK